ncbi:hypothetical protein HF086_003778 [Spodoptera exigua]|uniref:CCHC-type domain-containing protein n=1 Tax=Spodoptera exigua TaxID=7107 RepID=A0A922MWV3_SPOEX|nr:hypothetical protein HF086_003778 [Spodoptera exigua]
MSQASRKLADPIKKRSYIKGRLTMFKTYIDNIEKLEKLTDQQISELRLRISKLEACFSTFDDLQSEIEIESENPDEQMKALDQPIDYWDTIIIHLAVNKLDHATSRRWEEHKSSLGEVPTLDEFFKFIRDRADVLEASRPSKLNIKAERAATFVASSQPHINRNFNNNCVICNQEHRLFECTRFISMSLDERNDVVSKYKLCINCFKPGHRAYNCKSFGCKICKYKHNALLHRNRPQSEDSSTKVSSTQAVTKVTSHSTSSVGVVAGCEPPPTELAVASSCAVPTRYVPPSAEPVSLSTVASQYVLLSTALVKVFSKNKNKYYVARVLLDSGSQLSLVTESFCKKLGLSCKRIDHNFNINGIGNSKLQLVESSNFVIKSMHNNFSVEINCMILPRITNMLPSVKVNVDKLNIPGDILVDLADSRFYEPSEVDILIGADLFWELVTSQQVKLGKGLPTLQSSKLGWLVTGPVDILCIPKIEAKCNLARGVSDQLEKFWKVEEVICIDKIPSSTEEEFCEKHFVKNMYRTENGRFCIKMPFHTSPSVLGDTFVKAKSRLINLEKRLKKQPGIKDIYEQLEQMRQHFWMRWQHEYISELQHRTKWRKPDINLRIGDMVIIKESNLPPLRWKIGRIHDLHMGNDGVSRVADVRTASGTVRRAINRLCPLFEPEDEQFKKPEDGKLKVRPSTGGVC